MSDAPEPLVIDANLEAELMALMAEGRTIEAIKRLRADKGCGLKEAFDWVNRRLATGRWERLRAMYAPCPYCREPLRTQWAQQCLECGMDWHNPAAPVRR